MHGASFEGHLQSSTPVTIMLGLEQTLITGPTCLKISLTLLRLDLGNIVWKMSLEILTQSRWGSTSEEGDFGSFCSAQCASCVPPLPHS